MDAGMRIAIVADVYPPNRCAGALQLRDLARELVRQSHRPTAVVPSADLRAPWSLEETEGVEVLRLRAPRTKDIGYLRRAAAELLLPWAMLTNLRRCPIAERRWDGVIWYSPTIFLGPFVQALKKSSGCRGYLILRDIYPDWAVDLGLLGQGPVYWLLKRVEHHQYSVADAIGVQGPGSLAYFEPWKIEKHVEVLPNWRAAAPDSGSCVSVAQGPLAGRKIFVYTGNMGVAQGLDGLIDLAERMRSRRDVGLLFVGRGSELPRLRRRAEEARLDNVMFHDEIDPAELPGLYSQCHVGLVALDPRHRTHNTPGKFLSYLQAGLPVLARLNEGNDLADVIEREGVGRVCLGPSVEALVARAEQILNDLQNRDAIALRCRSLAALSFSPATAATQITAALRT